MMVTCRRFSALVDTQVPRLNPVAVSPLTSTVWSHDETKTAHPDTCSHILNSHEETMQEYSARPFYRCDWQMEVEWVTNRQR
jgi:hypothetical protein